MSKRAIIIRFLRGWWPEKPIPNTKSLSIYRSLPLIATISTIILLAAFQGAFLPRIPPPPAILSQAPQPTLLELKTWGGSHADLAWAVAVDSAGNSYVAASTYSYGVGSPMCPAIVILKYSSLGTLMWQELWTNVNNIFPHGIAVDSSSNVYVAGGVDSQTCVGYSGQQDALLIKIDSQGVLQWQKSLIYANGYPVFNSVAADSFGNVYAAGTIQWSHGAGQTDILIAKFNATTGDMQWAKTWGGSLYDTGNGIALDSSGNVFVVGLTNSFGASGVNTVLLSLSPSANIRFQKIIGNGNETGNAVALDNAGDIYVSGFTNSRGSNDMLLLRANSSGGLNWERSWGGSNGTDIGYGVVVDSSGNLALVGSTNSYGAGGFCGGGLPCDNIALVRVNSSGAFLSSLIFGDARFQSEGFGVAAEPLGSLVAVGLVSGPPPYYLGSGNSTLGTLSLETTSLGNSTLGTPSFAIKTVPNGVITSVTGSQTYAGNGDAVLLVYGNQVEVDFATNPTSGGSIIFNSTTYTNGENDNFALGNATATANAPMGFQFNSWNSTGGINVINAISNPTGVTVKGSGTLTAKFTAVPLPLAPLSLLLAIIATPAVYLIGRRRTK